MALDKNGIAQRIAQELKTGWYINLGIGIPTLVANYLKKDINVEFQSENGILGMGPFPYEGEEDADLINAGKHHCGMAEAWLAVLPQGSLSTAVDGSVSLTWQQMDGSAIGVTRSDASE